MRKIFDHKTLGVYQGSVVFVAWADTLLEGISKLLAVPNPLECVPTSKRTQQGEADSGTLVLMGIVAMVVGRIRTTSPSRRFEESAEYLVHSSESRD